MYVYIYTCVQIYVCIHYDSYCAVREIDGDDNNE